MKRIKIECCYLNQIQKHVLDFDLIPQCCVCLSVNNIYCCLACGKYFEGAGVNSHGFIHALEKDHNLFISVESQEAICLPEGYHVDDDVIEDIKYNLKPAYTPELIKSLELETPTRRSLDGHSHTVGLIPLNNLKGSVYASIVLYLLSSITELRQAFLLNNYSGLTQEIAQVFKKMWNPQSFKNSICPYQLFEVVSKASKGKFTAYSNNDPQSFLPWVANQLKNEGFVEKLIKKNLEGKLIVKSKICKFLYLKLKLNQNSPFIADGTLDKIYLDELISSNLQIEGIELLKTGTYLILLFIKYQHNGFFVEKSKQVVDYGLFLEVLGGKYKLVFTVSLNEEGTQKTYQANILHINKWYEIEDLSVSPIMDHSVTQKEPYILIYKKLVETDSL